eukprot:scaffold5428_cov150-Skeletonema_menzelii.AAC.1
MDFQKRPLVTFSSPTGPEPFTKTVPGAVFKMVGILWICRYIVRGPTSPVPCLSHLETPASTKLHPVN